MKNRKHEFEQIEQTTHTTKPVLTGFLVGGVIGAATALLFAPRSGEETCAQIRGKAVELRDHTTETVNEKVSQARSRADEIKDVVSEKAEEGKKKVEEY